jgi:hypothetical protein
VCVVYQNLREEHEIAHKELAEMVEQRREDNKEESRAVLEMTARGKGRPKSLAFEHQVRTILGSGCSARAAGKRARQCTCVLDCSCFCAV